MRIFRGLCGIAVVCLLWQAVCVSGVVDNALFPAPDTVFAALYDLILNGGLWRDIRASGLRFCAGYLLAVVSGTGLGLLLGRFPVAWDYINPLVQLTRPVSPLAWMPFIVLWLGIGDIPAIAVIFIAAFFPVLLTTVKAVRDINPLYINVAKNFGFSSFALMRSIIIPATLPRLVGGLRLALGTAWVFLVVGEMVGAQSGLGFLIIDARNTMRADRLMAAILVIGLMGLCLDWALERLEQTTLAVYSNSKPAPGRWQN